MLDITPSDEMREALKEVGVEVLGVKEGSAANGRRMVRESGDAGTRQSRGFGHREQLPLELMIVIPELAKGTYMVEVVTQYSSNGLQKESRTTLFDRILTVS